jgi:hypothetical protein
LTIWSLAASLAAGPALAQQLMIFPSKDQSQDQQNKDRGECHSWAVNQTGYDPALASTTPPPSSEPTEGGVVKGAARGAATGAVIGAIAGDAGKGAAMGAAGGGMIGGMRRRDQQQRQAAQQQQWQAQQEAQRQNYRRALSACLEGKGYTVK